MNLQKAKILLEKINSLHKSMNVDAGNIANIEKDLMRDYIRQLYDAYMNDTPNVTPEQPKVEIIKSTPKPPRRRAPKPVEVEVIHADESIEIEVPTPQPAPTPRPKQKPRVISLPDSLKDIASEALTPAPTPPTPAPRPKPTPPLPPTPKPKQVVAASEEVEELFEQPTATDLSEQLSNAPIKDLRKAMGLNEKIFTINELFGGEQGAFDSAILMLNSFDNFDQARPYLIENIAVKYGWVKRGKKKKAKAFIKLIRRRYN